MDSQTTLYLGQRYGAAWAELSTRISQRQSVLHFYATVATAIFGFYFSRSHNETMAVFLVISITALTSVSALLIQQHQVAIKNLITFLWTCEHAAKDLIRNTNSDCFYFRDVNVARVANFHVHLRYWQKATSALTLGVYNLAAILVTSLVNPTVHVLITVICIIVLVFSFLILFITFSGQAFFRPSTMFAKDTLEDLIKSLGWTELMQQPTVRAKFEELFGKSSHNNNSKKPNADTDSAKVQTPGQSTSEPPEVKS